MSSQLVLLFLLCLLWVTKCSIRPDEVIFVIISQQYEYNKDKAVRLQETIEQDNDDVRVYLSQEFNHPGHWTLLPIMSRIWKNHNKAVKWFFFCTEDTKVNMDKLLLSLTDKNFNNDLFIGHGLTDKEPTIIHHFSSNLTFQYPLFASGFVLSRGLMKRVHNRLKKEEMILFVDFSIDSSFELASYLWDNGRGVLLTVSSAFCIGYEEHCATFVDINDICDGRLNINDIYFAVKTFDQFHKGRLKVVLETWGAETNQISYFSNLQDDSIPTVVLNVPNSPHGHCLKTANILKYVSKKLKKEPGIKWVVIADDDTILSVKRVQEITSCYDHTVPVVIGERYGYNLLKENGYNYLTGGSGVLLSSTAVRKLTDTKDCVCSSMTTPDDMFLFGLCLKKLNISLVHSPLFHQARPDDYSPDYLAIGHPVSFHKHWMVDPHQVYDLWFRHYQQPLLEPSHSEL